MAPIIGQVKAGKSSTVNALLRERKAETDVLPMTAWAKLTMALQSIVSLSLVGLVIARAVNVFS